MSRKFKYSSVYLEILLFLCIVTLSFVTSYHNDRNTNVPNRNNTSRGRPFYIQRPDYAPEYDNISDSMMNDNLRDHAQTIYEQSLLPDNLENSSKNDSDATGLDSDLVHGFDNDTAILTDNASANILESESISWGSNSSKSLKSQNNSRQRNIRDRNVKSRRNSSQKRHRANLYNQRRSRQRGRRNHRRPNTRQPDDSHTQTTNHQNTGQHLVDPLVLKAYKEFHDKTISTCQNGTNYMCKADPKNRTILYFMCILSKQKCDGIKQCPLGDDEENCQLPVCKELQVRCREGTCATVCNGIPECDQLEDELFCGPVCKEGHLRCPDGNCAVVCDGKDDCKNKEDERNCKENLSSTDICKYGEVLCPDRKKCAKICDGIPQCEGGADEKFIC